MSQNKPASTSHAHNIDPVKDGKLGDASKTLNDHYAKAKAAQLQKQAETRQQSPNMSFAKSVQMDTKENKLDASSKDMRGQFERAKAAQMSAANDKGPAMKAPAPSPGMHLRPGGSLQRQVDGPLHRKELSDYNKHVKSLSDSVKARKANDNQAELKNERTKDHDRGR